MPLKPPFPYPRPNPKRLPKAEVMTIGIGVLATSGKIFKPDSLIMISDTLGSYQQEYATDELHKMWVFPKERLYAVGADDIGKCGELVQMIRDQFSALKNEPRREHVQYMRAMRQATLDYRLRNAEFDILSKYSLKPEQWTLPMDPSLRAEVLKDWATYYAGCQLVIGTFSDSGQALLYVIDGLGTQSNAAGKEVMELVSIRSFPGFAAIGIGAGNADFWLCKRDQKLSYSLRRSALHALEAKSMADQSPNVNDHLEMVIANRDEHFHFIPNKPEPPSPPVRLAELQTLCEAYGITDTEELDQNP